MFFKRGKSTSNDNFPEPEQAVAAAPAVTVVAAGTTITGDLVSDGEVRIAGTMTGNLDVSILVVESGGLIEGEVRADEATIRGRLNGPLRAYRVHLEAGAQVDGDVTHDGLMVDNGADLNGSVRRSSEPLESSRNAPPAAGNNAPGYTRSSLWTGGGIESYRPLVAVRPR